MVGSDYIPEDIGAGLGTAPSYEGGLSAAQDPALSNIDPTTGLPTKSWLKRLAESVTQKPQQQQTTQQQQATTQQATQAQQAAQKSTDPGPGAAGAGAGYQPGAKSGQWMTSDPAAIGKGERAQRQGAAIESLGHSVGTIIRLLVSMGAGGAVGGVGGAAGAAGAGADAAGAAGGAAGATAGAGGELLTPGGTPETSSMIGAGTTVPAGAGGNWPMGGGGGGSALGQLAQQYFGGGQGGGNTYSKILQALNYSGTPSGTGETGGTGGVTSGGGGAPWVASAEDTMSLVQGAPQKRQKALAAVEGLGSLTSTGGIPGGGSAIPWAT